MPLSPERLPLGAKLALYRLIRRRAVRAAAPLDATSVDPAIAGWRTTLANGVELVRAGRWPEADALLARGLAVFPGDPGLLIEHALAADGAGHHREAIARWNAALAAAPSASICYFSLVSNLREIGETDEARSVIEAARRRFPKNPSVLAEAGRVAEAEARFAEAADLFGSLVRRRDPHPDWLRGHAHALAVLGRFAEAETLVKADLPPDEAAANVAYLKQMLNRKDTPRPGGSKVPLAALSQPD